MNYDLSFSLWTGFFFLLLLFQKHPIDLIPLFNFCTMFNNVQWLLIFSVQGLAQIAQDVATLAAKAREGKLQPQEFQVRTLLNVKDFSNH